MRKCIKALHVIPHIIKYRHFRTDIKTWLLKYFVIFYRFVVENIQNNEIELLLLIYYIINIDSS